MDSKAEEDRRDDDPYDILYAIAIGPVLAEKIPYGDEYWKTFNASFNNEALTSLEIATAIREGHPITAPHKNKWRTGENFILGQHLGVDFDTGDERSSMDVLSVDKFFASYGAILYSTPSSTPEAPRSRMVFLLDTPIQQAKNYSRAAAALLWVYSTADRQCHDAARFFYGGRPGACNMVWEARVLPLSIVRGLIGDHEKAIAANRPKPAAKRYEPTTPDEHEVMSALTAIPPWQIDYDRWLEVLMAIHSVYPDASGLHMAEGWAQGYEGEVARKWRGFRLEGNTSGRVTKNTLFALAKDFGWTPKR